MSEVTETILYNAGFCEDIIGKIVHYALKINYEDLISCHQALLHEYFYEKVSNEKFSFAKRLTRARIKLQGDIRLSEEERQSITVKRGKYFESLEDVGIVNYENHAIIRKFHLVIEQEKISRKAIMNDADDFDLYHCYDTEESD